MNNPSQCIFSFIMSTHILNNKINKNIQKFVLLEKKYLFQFLFIFSGIKNN